MKRLLFPFLAATLVVPLFLLSGCFSYRIGDFSVASIDDYDQGATYRFVGRMEGIDKVPIVLFLLLGSPRIDDAVQTALQANGGVYMTNVVVREETWWFLLFGRTGYKIVGDVYAPVGMGAELDGDEETFTLIETEDGPAMQSNKTGDMMPATDVTHLIAPDGTIKADAIAN